VRVGRALVRGGAAVGEGRRQRRPWTSPVVLAAAVLIEAEVATGGGGASAVGAAGSTGSGP
jgi:hypothetical protein